MKRVKTLVIFIAVIAISGCSGYKDLKTTIKNILDFRNCELAEKSYNYVEIELPKGFKKKQTNIEGFCEYRFSYKDKSVIYITTNIYKGSRLNYGNLDIPVILTPHSGHTDPSRFLGQKDKNVTNLQFFS